MMIRRPANVPKVIVHPRITQHPLITSPTKGQILPGKQPIHGVPNYPWLRGGINPRIGPHPIGPISPEPKLTFPITPGNILRPPGFPTKYITPYHPITPITPYHPITTPIHPVEIIREKVATPPPPPPPPPPSQPDTSGVIGAGIGALLSLLLGFL
ncbi:MAG: hypothetical protein QW203_07745 [Thermoplasmatales archaeon]